MGRSYNPVGGGVEAHFGQEILSAFTCPILDVSVNDYFIGQPAFVNASLLELSATAAVNITGLTGATARRVLTLINTSAESITLKNANGASQAVNQFNFGADVVLNQNNSITLLGLKSGGWGIQGAGPSAAGAAAVAVVRLALANQNVAPNTPQAITWDTAEFDPSGLWNGETKFIVKAAGQYLVTASVDWNTAGQSALGNVNAAICWFEVNGNGVFQGLAGAPSAFGTFQPILTLSQLLNLNAGDYVELWVEQTTGSEATITSSATNLFTSFGIASV
jgi:hypothetical protein